MAHHLGAATVVATTRHAERRGLLERAGADQVVVTEEQDLAETTRDLTGGGADLVLDHIAGPALNDAIQAARIGGTVISVGRLASRTADLDLFGLARRAVRLQSVSFGVNPPTVIGDLLDGVAAELLPLVADGRLTPLVHSALPFEELPRALELLRSGRAQGKIALTVP